MRRFRIIFLAAAVVASASICSAQKLNWSWSNPQPFGNDTVGMAWNGTLGVAVCDLGQVYASPDLVNWFPQNSNLTNDLEGVTFFGNRIIITGSFGAVAYSDDGVNFTASSLNTTNWLVSVAASSNLVVAVGDNGALYTSPDGATWHPQTAKGLPAGIWLLSVAYGNGFFVTTGEAGYIGTSADGTNWNAHSIPEEPYGDLEDVAWINTTSSNTNFPYSGFWAVTDTGYAFYSTNNGTNWQQFTLTNSTNVLYALAADNATGLLDGVSEARLGSQVTNRLNWPEQVGSALTNVPPWTYFTALSPTNGVYEIAGYDGIMVESSFTNGVYNWNPTSVSPRDWLWQAAFVGSPISLYVAVGDNVRIMTSQDGADWTVEAVPLTNSVSVAETVFLGVGGDTNLFIAAGTRGSLAISPSMLVPVVDTNAQGGSFTNLVNSLGIVWDSMPAPAGTTNDLAGVCAFNGNYYLIGGNGTLLVSPDGTNWTALNSTTTNYLSGISAFTNGTLTLTGNEGIIFASADGTNWTKMTSGTTNWLYHVRCVGGQLLAVGENGTLLTSTDATNWSSLHSGVTNWLNDAVIVSNTCYIVGNQGVVLASTNFVNWTNIGTITSKSLEGAATENGQLIVVGDEGSILRSQVVPVLTPVNFVSYGQANGVNLFEVAGVVGQQFTLDSSTDLMNWVTGPLIDLIYGDGTLVFYQDLPTDAPPNQFYRCTLVP